MSQTPAFASATVSSLSSASSSAFHRPFLQRSLFLTLPTSNPLVTMQALPLSTPIHSTLNRMPITQRAASGSSANRSSRTPRSPDYSQSSQTSRSANNNVQPNNRSPRGQDGTLANLHELTERIADLLHVGSFYKNPIHCPKDAPLGYLSANTHVAVIFGKHLIRDQISVEYAKRIVTFIKQIVSGSLKPDIICFTGGKGRDDRAAISEAAAGYAFFRGICEEICFDVSGFDFILEERSHNTKENFRYVIDELRRRSGSQAISACHFTLVSSDYHLIRIQEVHRLSPRQSILFPLEVSRATWNCIFAAYPFCVSRDPATAFLGRTVVLANDLGILHVNLNGAVDAREFISRENLHRLNETFAKMREMYRVIDVRVASPSGFCTDMRAHAEMLELAIHDIRQVQTLLNPLLEDGASVPREHLELARKLVEATIIRMRSSMDPDRVLLVHDRLAIIDDLMQYRIEEKRRHAEQSKDSGYDRARGSSSFSDGRANTNETAVPEGFPPTPFLEESSARDPEFGGRMMRQFVFSNEVTWKGSVQFEGNGKKIARDGPTVVIIDDSMPSGQSHAPQGTTSNSNRSINSNNSRALLSTQEILGQTATRTAITNGSGRRQNSSTPSSDVSSISSKSCETNFKKRRTSSSRKVVAQSPNDLS